MNFQFYSFKFQGKSTVAVHTANALVDQGFKVLFWNFRISFFFFRQFFVFIPVIEINQKGWIIRC